MFYPYPNKNALLLGEWYWNEGPQKSKCSFKIWAAIDKALGSNDNTDIEADWLNTSAGWQHSDVTISVPFHSCCRRPGPKTYTTPDFYHHSLINHQFFHFEPYEFHWHPRHKTTSVNMYGELFVSRAFLEEHQRLQYSPGEPDCDLPRSIIALMYWSDATHLTLFGKAKLWTPYVYFGNESKYLRGQPSRHLCTHAAYFPPASIIISDHLPDDFQDFVLENSGSKMSDTFFTHLLTCCDGIARRLFPRIFTYSADYPEKVLIATIRNLGRCPCPRCLISKAEVQHCATGQDMLQHELLARSDTQDRQDKISEARRLIYEQNYSVDSVQVEALLWDESWVPTANAFSTKLHHTGFDLFRMLIVDFLHEFELGVWKAVFIHLLRILDTLKKGELLQLDHRYRCIPTFGRDTIRRFRNNVSEMSRTAARDYEDILQCSIPVFEKLLPEPYNTQVLQLLFLLCHWHGLAKLRLHTDETLDTLATVTSKLMSHLRKFVAETCPGCQAKEAAGRQGSTTAKDPCQPKVLNLQTYKLHALADYPAHIRMYGTTDSHSTQLGEQEHRTSKSCFTRTSRKKYITQLASIERRQSQIQHIRSNQTNANHSLDAPSKDPEQHHSIGVSQDYPEELKDFVKHSSDSLSVEGFTSKLEEHLLPRIQEIHKAENDRRSQEFSSFEPQDPWTGLIPDVTALKELTDIINPITDNCNVMMLSSGSNAGHRFCYAHVLGIYHANVIYLRPSAVDYQPRRLEFLWVRWFELLDRPSGWDHIALDLLWFVLIADEGSFGFIDPGNVLRACHLIPAFAHGKQPSDGIPISQKGQDCEDWKFYYVNRFVDRDMLLRYYWGCGVGHIYLHTINIELPPPEGNRPKNKTCEDMGDSGSHWHFGTDLEDRDSESSASSDDDDQDRDGEGEESKESSWELGSDSGGLDSEFGDF
ncbi:hypothetical protein BDN67DRAFT_1040256 [Paxillus ammoniavirescens]|nr:hypothetical protein BDN67DRAFT_1040256 [Paxillus ammoniavirescens]